MVRVARQPKRGEESRLHPAFRDSVKDCIVAKRASDSGWKTCAEHMIYS